MGRAKKTVEAFIDNIPSERLTNLPASKRTIHQDTNLRLDMQGLTSDKPPKYNLQVQANKQAKETTLKNIAPKTVAMVLVPTNETWTSEKIRTELTKSIMI